jgi:hypothetical protein
MTDKTNTGKKLAFERKNKTNGTPNPKYVDLLDVDKSIAGQNFGCFSFISPNKILKQKEMFFFEEFLKKWEMNKSMEKFHQFLNFISYKYKLKFDEISKDLEEFVKEERETIINSSIEDDYKTFLDKEEEELEKLFKKYGTALVVRLNGTSDIPFEGIKYVYNEIEMHENSLRFFLIFI